MNYKKLFSAFLVVFVAFLLGSSFKLPNDSHSEEIKVMISTDFGIIKIELYNETPLHRDNFVKLVLRAVTKTSRGNGDRTAPETQPGTIDLIIEEKGIAKSMASFNLRNKITEGNSLILKLEKSGGNYTASYSLDGVKYDKLGTASMLLKDIKAGLIVCDGTIIQGMKSTFWFNSDTTKPSTPFDVSFDYFRIENSGLK